MVGLEVMVRQVSAACNAGAHCCNMLTRYESKKHHRGFCTVTLCLLLHGQAASMVWTWSSVCAFM